MPLSHERFAISNTAATKVTPTVWESAGPKTNCTLQIQNLGSDPVYVGAENITSISYGCAIGSGATLTIDDLPPQDAVYVLSSSSSGYVGVLRIVR